MTNAMGKTKAGKGEREHWGEVRRDRGGFSGDEFRHGPEGRVGACVDTGDEQSGKRWRQVQRPWDQHLGRWRDSVYRLGGLDCGEQWGEQWEEGRGSQIPDCTGLLGSGTICLKVRVTQLCPTLRPHGLYSPWNSPGQNTGAGSLSLLQGIFPTQGLNPGLLHCWWIFYQLRHKGSPRILEWVAYPFSRGSSQPRNQTGVSCIAGRLFTNWAMRKAYFLFLILLPVEQTSIIHHHAGPGPLVSHCWKPFLISRALLGLLVPPYWTACFPVSVFSSHPDSCSVIVKPWVAFSFISCWSWFSLGKCLPWQVQGKHLWHRNTESTFRASSLLLAVLSDSENAVLGIASSYLLISVLILNTLV